LTVFSGRKVPSGYPGITPWDARFVMAS
jgi:hypothetical protein